MVLRFKTSGIKPPAASHFILLCAALAALLNGCGGIAVRRDSLTGPTHPPDLPFTVVVLPDTQCYSAGEASAPGACGPPTATSAQGFSQTEWVVKHAKDLNIAAVVYVGDLVDYGPSIEQWQRWSATAQRLDDAGIPYAPAIGNHDYHGYSGIRARAVQEYSIFAGTARIRGRSWFGGSWSQAPAENFWIRFDVGRYNLGVIALEFCPRDGALAWAQTVLDENQDRKFILSTHSHVTANNEYSRTGIPGSCDDYFEANDDANNGDQVWEKLIRHNDRQLFLVVSGHFAGTPGLFNGVGRVLAIGSNGVEVVQVMQNYQFDEAGGDGYLRVYTFNPNSGIATVNTYSPYLDNFRMEPENRFNFGINMK